MSDNAANLRRKIQSAGDLQSVVRTMKAVAASSIGQYEQSVRALADYSRTVELGLGVCFRKNSPAAAAAPKGRADAREIGIVVFGSDQGLVGQFNEVVTEFAIKVITQLSRDRSSTRPTQVWAVGERIHARLSDAGVMPKGLFAVPSSVEAIAPLVGKILIESEAHRARDESSELYLIYNRPASEGGGKMGDGGGVYAPFSQRLLPLDAQWQEELTKRPWQTRSLPEIIGDRTAALRAFIRGYLFVSLFRACAESLASENASRLAAMQRADKNIDDLLEGFKGEFHRVRQSSIDEELFDVIAGFEALARVKTHQDTRTTQRDHP